MNEILTRIRNAFDSLWHIRPRGRSFEVITPFPAAGDKFVSVFITMQNGNYIVTDGGWICDDVYAIGKDTPDLSKIFDRIYDYFVADFVISKTLTGTGRVICFKSTHDERLVPKLVFDVANFVAIVASMALVPLKEEVEQRNKFRAHTADVISELVGGERFQQNAVFTEKVPAAKFNAIISMPDNRSVLINCITGSSPAYMVNGYCKSNAMFDMLQQARADTFVKDKIVIMDDCARGFEMDQLRGFFDMGRAKGQRILMWSKDEHRLAKILN